MQSEVNKLVLSETQISSLKQFCGYVSKNPDIVNSPQLEFFKSFLLEFGATKIPKPVTKRPLIQEISTSSSNNNNNNNEKEKKNEEEGREEEKLKEEYLDEMGDSSLQISKEAKDKAIEYKEKAAKAMTQLSDFRRAAILYGYAIYYSNGKSSILFIKRAECLLEINKPLSARRDCTRAIDLNSDAEKAYLLRAKANLKLNNLDDVHRDLIYVDESQFKDEYTKVKKEYEEKKENERKKRVANEINAKLKFNGVNESSIPSWMSPQLFEKVAKDTSLLTAFQTPRLMKAIEEIATNPNAFLKYKDDPEVLSLFMKFSKIMQ